MEMRVPKQIEGQVLRRHIVVEGIDGVRTLAAREVASVSHLDFIHLPSEKVRVGFAGLSIFDSRSSADARIQLVCD